MLCMSYRPFVILSKKEISGDNFAVADILEFRGEISRLAGESPKAATRNRFELDSTARNIAAVTNSAKTVRFYGQMLLTRSKFGRREK